MDSFSLPFLSGDDLYKLVFSAVVFFILWVFGFAVKQLVWKRLRKISSRTSWAWDDELIARLDKPAFYLITFTVFTIALDFAPKGLATSRLVLFATAILVTFTLAWAVDRAITVLIQRLRPLANLSLALKSWLQMFARMVIYGLATLVVLDKMGISITPFLASLGVGSIAVALALQDTLGNLFSGFYLAVDKPVRIGDNIKLENGAEGVVRHIGWRSTRIELPSSNTMVIPNSKFSSSAVINYDVPASDFAIAITLGVSYTSDLDHVEKVVEEVAKQCQETVPNAIREFEPQVRYTRFADSSIEFTVGLCAKRFNDQNLLKHEFIKALKKRFDAEKIEIPYPQRVIYQVPTT